MAISFTRGKKGYKSEAVKENFGNSGN